MIDDPYRSNPRTWSTLTFLCVLIATISFMHAGWCQDLHEQIELEHIRSVFLEVHDGWSVDEVLLDDQRRNAFVKAMKHSNEGLDEKSILESLLAARKSGKLAVETSRQNRIDLHSALTAAEIAARLIQDRFDAHTDQMLVDPELRREFDRAALKLAPDQSPYALRKAALKLRKTRRLRPELTLRVTDWKRSIVEYPLAEVESDVSRIPEQSGIYLFRDRTGYLYIGQSQNLRGRLTKHLLDSDRKNLSEYLKDQADGGLVLELHIFDQDSPAQKLSIREAYESELIRSRSPRLNIAP